MRPRVIQVWLVAMVMSLCFPKGTSGRPIMPTFEMLTRAASLIVVAQVENVTQEGDMSIATARVTEVWKGQTSGKVQFRASRSWICDVSKAISGETVVLFLAGDAKTTVMAIAYSGIGRLPVDNAKDYQTVILYGRLFTKSMKQEASVLPETFSGSVTLAMLRRHVEQLAQGSLKRRSVRSA